MSSTIGQLSVLSALAFAVFGALGGLCSLRIASGRLVRWSVWGFFASMLLANLTMVQALVRHDFSVRYVAQVGSRATPLVFTIVSLWSALEGSILFWGLILACYLLAFHLASRTEEGSLHLLGLGAMLSAGAFFSFLLAGPADPFGHLSPAPLDGPGPNPLLQNHLLMVIHPPMLYLGYVGMVVPFGMAIASLIRGELGPAWTVRLRRWTLVGWSFLTVGIILGSWWAYAVLGWGGYWAWDPVENASLLPWLTSTAFLHSTMVHERRGVLKLWTVSLALATFVLTILGTFMTRSGIFNSVHSFTQSDIGPTFLAFIALVLIASLALLAVRGHRLHPEGTIDSPLSRESSILVNNLLLVALTFTVLIGSIYPLIAEAVRGVKVSVGEPYFDKMAVPCGLAILFLMGIGPSLPWGKPDLGKLYRQLLAPSAAFVVVLALSLLFGLKGFYPLLTFALAAFVGVVTLRELFLPAWVRAREKEEPLLSAFVQSVHRSRRRFGGYLVHLGVIWIVVAIAASRSYVTHTFGTLGPAFAPLTIGPNQVRLVGFSEGEDPHRKWIAARLEVKGADGRTRELAPKMSYYERSTDPIGTPAIESSASSDLYLSLLAFSSEQKTATINAWIFPLVGWIWWSIPLLIAGALISLLPSGSRSAGAGAVIPLPEPTTGPSPQAQGRDRKRKRAGLPLG